MSNDDNKVYGPVQDYVHREKHVTKNHSRYCLVIKIFAMPMLMALFFIILLGFDSTTLLAGFSYGYGLQAFVMYSFNAIRALITGESRGI